MDHKEAITYPQYLNLGHSLHQLLVAEFYAAKEHPELIPQVLPKLILSVEFFSYLKGEFFNNFLPIVEKIDKKFFMEMHEIQLRNLKEIAAMVSKDDKRLQFCLQEHRNLFSEEKLPSGV